MNDEIKELTPAQQLAVKAAWSQFDAIESNASYYYGQMLMHPDAPGVAIDEAEARSLHDQTFGALLATVSMLRRIGAERDAEEMTIESKPMLRDLEYAHDPDAVRERETDHRASVVEWGDR